MPAVTPLPPAQFTLLCEVIESVARSGGLPPDDAADFAQSVHLRLLERQYAPITRYAGRGSFRGFLFVVVRRLLLDWRNRHLGKWRPCAESRRQGPAAVALDRLISRDGHPVDEAVAILSDRAGAPPLATLRALAGGLPRHVPVRPVLTDQLEMIAALPFEDPIEKRQDEAQRRRVLRAIRVAAGALSRQDRQLLYLRYGRGMHVSTIALLMQVPAKPLYRRLAQLVAILKRAVPEQRPTASKRRRTLPRSAFVH